MMHRLRARRALAPLAAAVLAVGGCSDLTVPDYNRPPLDDLRDNPNRTLVNAAAVGVLATGRADAVAFIRNTGSLGREGYYLDTNESRYVSQLVGGVLDPSSFAGGGLWFNRYSAIRLGNTLLAALGNLPDGELTDEEAEGVRGWTKTLQAIDFMAIAATRQAAPVAVGSEPTEAPAPLVDRAAVYAHARTLLDEAVAHLEQAGGAFSFEPTPGFAQFGMGTPAGVRRVNRAIRARLDVLTEDYLQALQHLEQSFLATPSSPSLADLHAGAYYPYGSGSGDQVNTLATAPPQVADTMLKVDAALQANGQDLDARFVRKVGPRSGGYAAPLLEVTSNLVFRHYNREPFFGPGGTSSPIPVIRNEELILLRAEARWRTGDLPGAIEDLNYVRVHSGGLAPRTDLTADNFRDALLYERRYSLLFEGGWRWQDLRRFGLLDTLSDYPRVGDQAPAFFPLPAAECDGRPAGTQGC